MNYKEFDQEYHSYEGDYPGHRLHCAHYQNANGFALAVVASLQFNEDGYMIDWAAYWHGCDLTRREEDAVRWVAKKGCKLSCDDAEHFFPYFPIGRYRG